MNVRNRVLRDAGCPYCNDRKVLRGFNDVATVREDLAAQWYQEGNLPLRPTYVTTRSKKRVEWRGDCGHVFKLTVKQRSKNKRLTCPYCTGHKKIERPVRCGWRALGGD